MNTRLGLDAKAITLMALLCAVWGMLTITNSISVKPACVCFALDSVVVACI
ncbi:hypothetical protein [Rhodoferax sp.]|uniref:hypothetical protein n=1 Tax=Rhodoferax sp. TaxID=50421 RepID=UPI0019E1D6C0|nr:hypothetical protein [Rhodoferax sp.]MBE0473092.1 hypothetical protein [Rhodoferax sp.]